MMRLDRQSQIGVVVVGLVLLAVAATGVGVLAWRAWWDSQARNAYAEYVREYQQTQQLRREVEIAIYQETKRYRSEHGRDPSADELSRLLDAQPVTTDYETHRARAQSLGERWGQRWIALGLSVPPR